MPAIVVKCDGCGAELPVQTKFAGHARAVAKGQGWATPPHDPVHLPSYSDADYCPICAAKPLKWPEGVIPHSATIRFRGLDREIEWRHEGDGVFCWHFEGDTFGTWTATAVTQAEEERVAEQLWEAMREDACDGD